MARKNKTPGALEAPGFEEAPQAAFIAADEARPGFGVANRLRLALGPGGRVVIPAALREAMQVNEGDALLAWVEDGELHLLSPRVGARQAQAMKMEHTLRAPARGRVTRYLCAVGDLVAEGATLAEFEAEGE